MMALMFIMALMATNWELFKSKSEKATNLELLDLLASPQVKRPRKCREATKRENLPSVFNRSFSSFCPCPEYEIGYWHTPQAQFESL